MKRAFLKRLTALMARSVAVPLLLLVAGCFSDPNIEAGKRIRWPGDPEPPAIAGTTLPISSGVPMPGDPPVSPVPPEGVAGGKIAIGDTLTILFSDMPRDALPSPMLIKVGNEGSITLPLNTTVQALGKTPTELERAIRSAYVPSYFVNLSTSVKAEERYFFVGGEVKVSSRQLYTSHSMTVLRAITTAGGFSDFAKKTKIEVRRANGGKTEHVDYYKALKDPKLDLPVYPNDQVIVPRGI